MIDCVLLAEIKPSLSTFLLDSVLSQTGAEKQTRTTTKTFIRNTEKNVKFTQYYTLRKKKSLYKETLKRCFLLVVVFCFLTQTHCTKCAIHPLELKTFFLLLAVCENVIKTA